MAIIAGSGKPYTRCEMFTGYLTTFFIVELTKSGVSSSRSFSLQASGNYDMDASYGSKYFDYASVPSNIPYVTRVTIKKEADYYCHNVQQQLNPGNFEVVHAYPGDVLTINTASTALLAVFE